MYHPGLRNCRIAVAIINASETYGAVWIAYVDSSRPISAKSKSGEGRCMFLVATSYVLWSLKTLPPFPCEHCGCICTLFSFGSVPLEACRYVLFITHGSFPSVLQLHHRGNSNSFSLGNSQAYFHRCVSTSSNFGFISASSSII